MSGWSTHQGTIVALDIESIDTDQLIPARFMSTPRSEGYGRFLLHDMRFDAEGAPIEGFPLSRHPNATVLVTRRNFGSGSSREAAVYALIDFGIRAVIAPSFGDIFAANAVNNGLLPAKVAPEVAEILIARVGAGAAAAQIDLIAGTLSVGDVDAQFDVDPVWREKLINGWDDIDLTRRQSSDIAAFRTALQKQKPWAFPEAETAG